MTPSLKSCCTLQSTLHRAYRAASSRLIILVICLLFNSGSQDLWHIVELLIWKKHLFCGWAFILFSDHWSDLGLVAMHNLLSASINFLERNRVLIGELRHPLQSCTCHSTNSTERCGYKKTSRPMLNLKSINLVQLFSVKAFTLKLKLKWYFRILCTCSIPPITDCIAKP